MGRKSWLISEQAIYIAGSPFINLPWGVDSYSVRSHTGKRTRFVILLTGS